MAITRLGGANAISGTIPQGNIANASLGAVTSLPAAIATGKVLQVVNGVTTTSVTSSSSTTVSSGITAQITPSSSSNKILVFGSINGVQVGTANSTGARIRLRRHDTSTSATSGTTLHTLVNYGGYDNSSSDTQYALSFNHLDTPNTTDARNYTITFRRSIGSGSVQFQNNSASSTITLLEIEG